MFMGAMLGLVASDSFLMLFVFWELTSITSFLLIGFDHAREASRRAALRYGFAFEGIFRQHMIYKGRNRDTAWYAIIDRDWPRLAAAHRAWLAPGNFDAQGRQRQSLSALTVA